MDELDFLLMGKTGQGKSATGNSILGRRAFTSATLEVAYREYKGRVLKVVDSPVLGDVRMKDINILNRAVSLCSGGVHAFLLVTRFGSRITEEEMHALDALKRIFGPTYLQHVIVVVTGGDIFESSVEVEEYYITFPEWCRKQNGAFRQLYETCEGRCLLFNNHEKDEQKKRAQIETLIQLTLDLTDKYGRYTSDRFKKADREGQKLILQLKAPQLRESIQEEMSRLVSEIDNISKDREPSESQKGKIRFRLRELVHEMCDKLDDLRKLLKNVEDNLDDVYALQLIGGQLKDVVRTKWFRSKLEPVCTLPAKVDDSTTWSSVPACVSQDKDVLKKAETFKMKDKLNFLLLGKTGHGKSATGNLLLNRPAFKTGNNVMSGTREVTNNFTDFEKFTFLIVDGPGLEDTEMTKAEDRTTAAKNMDKALAMCYGGVDAFLFVLMFGSRFTNEDKSTLEALKQVFGPLFLDHVIVIVTYGDLFHKAIEEEKRENISFKEWCAQERSEFRELYDACEERFVLVNNREKDEEKKRAQIQEIVDLTLELRERYGRYTSQCFKDADRMRERIVLKINAPHLILEIQEKVALLSADLKKLSSKPSDTEREGIIARIIDLKQEIKRNEHGVLNNLLKLVEKIEDNMKNIEKLHSLTKELEETRQAKEDWTNLGTVCADKYIPWHIDEIRLK